MAFRGAVGLLAWSAVASAKELAVVRPFASQAETAQIQSSFDSWTTNPPCSAAPSDDIDLYLVYSRTLSANTAALAAVNGVVESFTNRSAPWHTCFRAVHVLGANLSAAEDVYSPRDQGTSNNWVSGPNGVFRFIMRSFLNGTYDAIFLMELDSVPKRSDWINQFQREVNLYPAAAIRGSHYRGDKWDAFANKLSSDLLTHVNGNAVYYTKHPFLSWLSDQLHQDSAAIQSSVAYDVRLAELVRSAQGSAAWSASVPQGQAPYVGDSLLIGNYANTLLNTSFDGGEYVSHVATSNIYSQLPEGQATLVVHHFSNENVSLFEASLPTIHPFRQILVLTQDKSIANGTTRTVKTLSGDTLVTYHRPQHANYLAFCELAGLVTTKYFVFTDTFHMIASPVSILTTGGASSKPVVPYLETSSTWCQWDDRCTASLTQAQQLFNVSLTQHYDRYDTLFETSQAAPFCAAWQAAVGTDYLACNPQNGPSADDFAAWAHSTGSSMAAHYKIENREVKGWRAWTDLHTPHPRDTRQCAIYKSEDFEYEVGNISSCSQYVESPQLCQPAVGCMWRPMFQSGKCIPHHAEHPASVRPLVILDPTTTDPTAPTVTATTTTTVSTTTITTTTPIFAPVATVLIEINSTRVTKENVGQVLAELRSAVQAVQNGTQEAQSSATNDVRIELTESSAVALPAEPSPQEKGLLLEAVRVARCGDLTPAQCDVQEPGASTGLKATAGVSARRLSGYQLQFVVFIIIRDAADLATTTSIQDAGFATSFQSAVAAALNSSNASASNATALLGATSAFAPANVSTLTVIQVQLPENTNANVGVVQAEMTDTAALAAAITQASSTGGSLILQAPTADLCLGRTCGGNGQCSNGTCTCQSGWIGSNCLLPDPCLTVTCANGGTCAAFSGVCQCTQGWTGSTCNTPIVQPTPAPTPAPAPVPTPAPAPVPLSNGSIVGIVLGSIVGLIIVVAAALALAWKMAKASPAKNEPAAPVEEAAPPPPPSNEPPAAQPESFWV